MNTKCDYVAIIFYDLATDSPSDAKNYRRFRKALISSGYYQLQKSVYCKRYKEKQQAKKSLEDIKIISPQRGNVRGLIITSKVFNDMKVLAGDYKVEEKILNNQKIIEI